MAKFIPAKELDDLKDAVDEARHRGSPKIDYARANSPIIDWEAINGWLTDECCKYLCHLKDLERISISGEMEKFSGTGLQHFKGHPKLQAIRCIRTKISVEMIRSLAQIHTLRHLALMDCSLSDEAYDALANLKQLRSLSLRLTPCSDPQLLKLSSLENLVTLDVGGTHVTVQGLLAVGENWSTLECLDMEGTDVSNANIHQLTRFKHLSALLISHTSVTDDGLKHLSEFPDLSFLAVNNCGVVKREESKRSGAGTELIEAVGQNIRGYGGSSLDAWRTLATPVTGTGLITSLQKSSKLRYLYATQLPFEPADRRELGRALPNAWIFLSGHQIKPTSVSGR